MKQYILDNGLREFKMDMVKWFYQMEKFRKEFIKIMFLNKMKILLMFIEFLFDFKKKILIFCKLHQINILKVIIY